MCPKCGTGTESEYVRKKGGRRPGDLIGCVCRECKMIWNWQQKGPRSYIVGEPYQPAEATRIYEIVVTRTSHYIEAETAEAARQMLIEKLTPGDTSKKYGIFVEHHMDHAECNEGIPI